MKGIIKVPERGDEERKRALYIRAYPVHSGLGLIKWGVDPIGINKVWGARITNKQKGMLVLTRKSKSILIGVLLSDGWIKRGKWHWNPKIGIKQSIKNVKFLIHLINEIGYILPSGEIQINSNMLRGKRGYDGSITTRALPSLMEVVKILYVDIKGKLVRRIQGELINYMDNIVLAYWIMGNGNKLHGGIVLNTNGFTLKEVILLVNILIIKLEINPTLHKDRGRYKIYVGAKDWRRIRPRIEPYIIDHFKYKIN